MTITRADLIARARAVYPFRSPGLTETSAHYLDALIHHVADRDLAMAHELRVGRLQAEWTPEDVAAFKRFIGPPHDPREDIRDDFVLIADFAHCEPTEAALLTAAARALAICVDRRKAKPLETMPILCNVVLTDGRLMLTSPTRGDRVAVLKQMARNLPVFGFFVLADVFIHGIDFDPERLPAQVPTRATKKDALIAHVGTRDLRRMMTRTYRVVDGRAVFDEPWPDVDKRGHETMHDPYASIFVSVPTPPGVQ